VGGRALPVVVAVAGAALCGVGTPGAWALPACAAGPAGSRRQPQASNRLVLLAAGLAGAAGAAATPGSLAAAAAQLARRPQAPLQQLPLAQRRLHAGAHPGFGGGGGGDGVAWRVVGRVGATAGWQAKAPATPPAAPFRRLGVGVPGPVAAGSVGSTVPGAGSGCGRGCMYTVASAALRGSCNMAARLRFVL
jgi:hypothetical protein